MTIRLRTTFYVSWFLFIAALSAANPVSAQNDNLPIKKVVLLNTGVGYFQHEGTVQDDGQIDLTFGVDDINDLLKSMVLQDLDGGEVSAISYAPQDPNGSKLHSFDIDLSDMPTMVMLLSRLRGEKISISGIEHVSGVVIGIEQKDVTDAEGRVSGQDYVNLLTETGIQRVNLSSIHQVKLGNEKLDSELRNALSFLASARGEDKRNVSIMFRGEGTRRVRIGYVRQTPTWKTSYRLVLGENETALLQGWAIVENTGQADWDDVNLSLVSGNPISFVMDLYEPLFVERPGVDVVMFDAVQPGVHNLATRRAGRSSGISGGLGGGMMGGMSGGGGFGGGDAPGSAADHSIDAGEGVSAAATAEATGQMFEYAIKTPVQLARMSSAMLPIINQQIKFERISLYNSSTHAKHPLDAVLLKNVSDVHITRGPITVYDDNAYAGDALTLDIQPGGERLVSYSLNSGVEVVERESITPYELRSVALDNDVLVFTNGRTRENEFEVINDTRTMKKMVIELPIAEPWKLMASSTPNETTRSLYRFSMEVDTKKTNVLKVEREEVSTRRVALDAVTPQLLAELDAIPRMDEKLKALIDKLTDLQSDLNSTTVEIRTVQERQRNINNEQTRIRSNLESLKDTSAVLYQRYVKLLTTQEDELELLSGRLSELRKQQRAIESDLDSLLGPFREKAKKSKKQMSQQAVPDVGDELDDVFK
jgi:hypothetical protein